MRLRRTFGNPIRRIASSFSLLFGLFGCVLGVDYDAVLRSLEASPSLTAKTRVLLGLLSDPNIDPALSGELDELASDQGPGRAGRVRRLVREIELRARFTRGRAAADAAKLTREIQSNPLYRKPDDRAYGNWMYRSLERLAELMRRSQSTIEAPRGPGPISGFDRILLWAVWILLGALFLAFLVFAIRHFAWKSRLSLKARALLDDGEPE